MDDLKLARKNAKARRKEVLTSIEVVRDRLTLPQLANDALSILDPELTLPRRIKAAVASQPLAASLLLAGASWLLLQNGEPAPPARSRRKPK